MQTARDKRHGSELPLTATVLVVALNLVAFGEKH